MPPPPLPATPATIGDGDVCLPLPHLWPWGWSSGCLPPGPQGTRVCVPLAAPPPRAHGGGCGSLPWPLGKSPRGCRGRWGSRSPERCGARLCHREGRAQSPGVPTAAGRGCPLRGVTAVPAFAGRIGVGGVMQAGRGFPRGQRCSWVEGGGSPLLTPVSLQGGFGGHRSRGTAGAEVPWTPALL